MRKRFAAVLKDGWTKALCAGVSLFASLAVTAGATVTVDTVTRGNPRSKISVKRTKDFQVAIVGEGMNKRLGNDESVHLTAQYPGGDI